MPAKVPPKAGASKRATSTAFEDAAAEVQAAEGAPPPPKIARTAPPAKTAPAPPPEPTPREKDMQKAKDKEEHRKLQEDFKKLEDQLKKVEREKQQLKEAQAKAKSPRRASQEQRPAMTNAQRRNEKVFVETNYFLSVVFDIVVVLAGDRGSCRRCAS